MAKIIRAQFMHQHKDKAVYERDIVLDTPTLNRYYGKPTTYLEFDMPLLMDVEPEFVKRWFNNFLKTYWNTHVTHRSLRFVGSDGKILCELAKRPFKVNFCIPQMTDISPITKLSTIHICCVVIEEDVKELGKIFLLN